ncbi:MAG: PadR family transcriptional regulator [Candidatus Odinarchaeota archaeon]
MPDYSFNRNLLKKRLRKGIGLQILILKALEQGLPEKNPITAYEIQSKIFKLTESFWKPSPGSIYPILEDLAKKKFILVEKRENKDHYSLTQNGKNILDQILSYKLLMDVFMFTRLYDTFDRDSIIIPTEIPQLEQQIQQVVSMMGDFVAQEGFELDNIREHITKIELEIRKEKTQDLIGGIDNYIHLLQFLKEKIIEQLDTLS